MYVLKMQSGLLSAAIAVFNCRCILRHQVAKKSQTKPVQYICFLPPRQTISWIPHDFDIMFWEEKEKRHAFQKSLLDKYDLQPQVLPTLQHSPAL